MSRFKEEVDAPRPPGLLAAACEESMAALRQTFKCRSHESEATERLNVACYVGDPQSSCAEAAGQSSAGRREVGRREQMFHSPPRRAGGRLRGLSNRQKAAVTPNPILLIRVVPLWPFLIKQTKISNRNRKPSNQNCKKLPPSLVFRRFGLQFQGFGFKPSNRIVKPNANAQTELVKF